tara:strand:+ start:430 stop:711 length:282 start_codon:yes stop_codon:yes gene_type:complete
MSLVFISELIKKNSNLQYHLATIIAFAVLYHILSKTSLVGEDEDERFHDFGTTLYYTVVTHFTIGYGDISPKTPLLRFLCCAQIILAFALTNL